jgi:Secretion system C-terminal sorting domain
MTLLTLFLVETFILISPSASGQSCGGTLSSMTYDTTVNGSGNTGFDYSVPQFPLSTSTLYAVTVRSIVTVSFAVTIQNNTGAVANAKVQLFRNDDIESAALADAANGENNDFNNSVYLGSAYSDPGMAAGAIASFGPSNVISNNSIIVDSLDTNQGTLPQSNWVGSGKNTFQYTPETGPNASPSGIHINSYSTSDQVTFSVTYYYCNPGTLSTSLLSFTAVKQNDQMVQLAWSTADEEAGRTYQIQVSTDGTDYSTFTSVASNPASTDASYSYNYPIQPNATGKLYFRLEIVDNTGFTTYSTIAIVNLTAPGSADFSIYPNPPQDFVNLTLPGDNRSWQIDIISADGSLIQRNYYYNNSNPRVNFSRKLTSGAYFVRANNLESGDRHTGSFIIP